jgi:hypothetical protein
MFGNTRGYGTPIVIDYSSDIAYYLHPTEGVRPLGGGGSGLQNYQFSCSDLGSDLVATTDAGYFRTQTPVIFYRVRASLLYPSVSGAVKLLIRNRDTDEIIIGDFEIPAEAVTTESLELVTTEIDDDTIVVVDIIEPGIGAKGLIVALVGMENHQSIE